MTEHIGPSDPPSLWRVLDFDAALEAMCPSASIEQEPTDDFCHGACKGCTTFNCDDFGNIQ